MKIENRTGKLVLVFFGMTAVGKSYVARALAEQRGWIHINSDVVRKELAGIEAASHGSVPINEGIYSPAFTRKTYDELICRAEKSLCSEDARVVILDASYSSLSERNLARNRLGQKYQLLFIYCICSEDVVKERLARRLDDPCAISDGSWDVYLEQKKIFMQPDKVEMDCMVILETDKALPELLRFLERRISLIVGDFFLPLR